MGTYTRGEAAGLLAIAIGAPNAKDWLCGWSAHEIACGVGCSHPQNNLWASGQPAPGSSTWNPPHHVQNYPTLVEGIAATAANLADPKYPAYQRMVHALQQGDYSSETVQAGLRTWCGSTCYSASAGSFIASGKQHAGDIFDDAGGTVVAPESSSCTSCLVNLPGQCPSGYHCVPLLPGSPGYMPGKGCCQADASPGQIVGSIFNFQIAGWDATRIGKWLLGLVLIGLGLLFLYAILTEKVENSSVVKGVSHVAELAG